MPAQTPIRVLHFVTGGFAGGATQVAIKLVSAALQTDTVRPLLVLRRKRHTDPGRIAELRAQGIPVEVVSGMFHWLTILQLVRICRRFRPDILVAHGFPEHILGRHAGRIALVPHLVQVEHNSRERYTAWRRWQARWLDRHTARIVGCGEGVRRRLLEMGAPPDRTITINNGINLAPFAQADAQPFAERAAQLLMVSRFARQKDHLTLIRALALLRERGLRAPLLLAGGGKHGHRRRAEQLAAELGLQDQVQFLGLVRDVPQRLMATRIAVLSTHYEGMPLALVEGMAAGCAVVGSAVPGVQEILRDGVNGRLVAHQDPRSMADALEDLLRDPALAERLARQARREAIDAYSLERMNREYEELFRGLMQE
jgi:glycosyltransferase involved in cell wall biosynthesis